jgi:dCMP deaminase
VISVVVQFGQRVCYHIQNALKENGMPNKFDYAHMDVAGVYAKLSSATRLQVGSVVVKDGRIISIGYNGMPAGWDNTCEDREYMSSDAGGWLDPEEIKERWPFEETGIYDDPEDGSYKYTRRYNTKTKPEVIHAEANAIAKLARSVESGKDSVMYITHAPCLDCSKLIYTAGIGKVFYRNQYRNDEGLDFLKKCNIEVEKL